MRSGRGRTSAAATGPILLTVCKDRPRAIGRTGHVLGRAAGAMMDVVARSPRWAACGAPCAPPGRRSVPPAARLPANDDRLSGSGSSSFRSAERPRDSQLATVPSGTPASRRSRPACSRRATLSSSAERVRGIEAAEGGPQVRVGRVRPRPRLHPPDRRQPAPPAPQVVERQPQRDRVEPAPDVDAVEPLPRRKARRYASCAMSSASCSSPRTSTSRRMRLA